MKTELPAVGYINALRRGNESCPFCEGVVEAIRCPNVQKYGEVEHQVSCVSCGRTWVEIYKIHAVRVATKEEIKFAKGE